MGKPQRSKRARKHRKQARFAFGERVARWLAHPSHVAARRYRWEPKDDIEPKQPED